MRALEDFDLTLTFCFTPEHRGIAAHHTSPPQAAQEYAEFCAGMVRRYAAGAGPAEQLGETASREALQAS
jgi:beta-xylosidase